MSCLILDRLISDTRRLSLTPRCTKFCYLGHDAGPSPVNVDTNISQNLSFTLLVVTIIVHSLACVLGWVGGVASASEQPAKPCLV